MVRLYGRDGTGVVIDKIINVAWLVFLATIAYIQLRALWEQANANFSLKFNREFFGNETNQKIIVAIEEKKKVLKENNRDK